MLELDLRLLRSFSSLAEDCSFTRAAVRLCMTQPALTLQIQKLEAQLGIRLFQRSTRAVILTAEGNQLLPYARRLMEQSSELHSAVLHLQRGGPHKFQIGAPAYTVDIPVRNAIMDRLIAESTDGTIGVHSARQNELIADVQRHKLDVAFLLGVGVSRTQYDLLCGGHQPGEGIYPQDLRTIVIDRRPIELLLPIESPLSHLGAVAPIALRGQQLVMFGCAEGRPLLQPIVRMFEAAGVQVVLPPEAHVAASVERYGRFKRLATLSLGWSGKPIAEGSRESGDMVRCEIAGWTDTMDLVAVASATNKNPAIDAFFELVTDVISIRDGACAAPRPSAVMHESH